jgi:hypothetical protein
MTDSLLDEICDLIQVDVGNRGLRTDPVENLITACPRDFQKACRNISETPHPVVAVVTGFFIPHAHPPCGETDGPLGALFLARALAPLAIKVLLVSDAFCERPLQKGLEACGLQREVPLLVLPSKSDWQELFRSQPLLTHLIALERVGPSHTPQSLRSQPGTTTPIVNEFLREVPALSFDRCHTMKGRDITVNMAPAHLLFEAATAQVPRATTIGIGDGGNEIGMGKIPWRVIRHNIPNGGLVACRVRTDFLVVCGVSNWGAYGLGAGVRHLRGAPLDKALFDLEVERGLLRTMVEEGPLVDGVTGLPSVTVDGLSFERYVEPLQQMGALR